MSRSPGSRTGRPRDPQVAAAIESSALRLVAELGFDAVSMDRIAADAGVGKPTIYRRWSTKADLLYDAVRHRVRAVPELPDTGSLRGDLLDMFTASAAQLDRDGRVAVSVMLALPGHAELARRIGELAGELIRRQARLVLDRAAGRGELPAGAGGDLFPFLAVEAMLVGAAVLGPDRADPEFLRRAVDELVLPALRQHPGAG